MNKVTMIACDLHDAKMVLSVAVDDGVATRKSLPTADVAGLIAWCRDFAARHGSSRIVFAYEASGRGFGLHDALRAAGIECHVLAPTHLPRTTHRSKNKTDEKDSLMILDELRAYVLAGRKLPVVWAPDPQTRDDREPVRMRLTIAEQRTQVKNQIRTLAKRSELKFPDWFTSAGEWSKRSLGWLRDVVSGQAEGLSAGGVQRWVRWWNCTSPYANKCGGWTKKSADWPTASVTHLRFASCDCSQAWVRSQR